MKSVFSILFLSFILTSTAQEWKLVYQNDEKGKPVMGDLEILLQSVRDGKDVRMGWWSRRGSNGKLRVQHLANASFLTILNDSVVFAQIEPIYGQTPDLEKSTITLKENLQWVLIGATNGKSDAMMTDTSTGEIVGHNSRERAFKWYVKD